MIMEIKEMWKKQGFIDEPVAEGTDLKSKIRELCKEKDAIILAHYYTVGEIQEVADFIGDWWIFGPMPTWTRRHRPMRRSS